MSKLRETFLDELADIYDAEQQLTKALPKLAEAAKDETLKDAFESHLEETENHMVRLEQVFEIFGEKAEAKKCKAMKGLIEEGEELIKEDAGDAGLICGAQKVEHYEIATYGSLATWAEILGEEDAVKLLNETLNEEKAADDKLTEIAESVVNAEEAHKAGSK
jgi:ferritin-like metal-binding protein YciE